MAATTPEDRITALDGAPIFLLPVRLETRYVGDPADPAELRIRVYPDQVHLDAHEPRLTAGELKAGKAYWRNRWTPLHGVDDAAVLAWNELTRGVRPPRAAWIVTATTPTNMPGDPAGPAFPNVRTRQAGIDLPLAARALPSQWVAIGSDADGHEILRRWFDKPIPAKLLATAVLDDGVPLDGGEAVDAYLGWASDYAQALAAGMAVTIKAADLAPGVTLADGFARFLVFGVDTAADSAQGAQQLTSLLSAHAFSDGLGYLKPGMPTNNTAAKPAADGPIPASDPATARPAAAEWSSAARLGRALGMPRGAVTEILPGAADEPARAAADLIDATWSATLGYFADQLLFPVVGATTLAAARKHAASFLQPLGPLPTLRVGRQPLGILPVVAPSRPPADDEFGNTLADTLAKLRPIWELAVPRIPRLFGDAAPQGQDVERVLVSILQRSPWSTRIWYRRVFGPLVGLATGGLGHAQQLQAVLRTIGFLDALGAQAQPRIVGLGLHDRTGHLRIPFLGPSESGEPPELEYLADIGALTMADRGREELTEHSAPRSLLDALARFAGVQEMDLAASRIRRVFLPHDPLAFSWRTPEISGIGTMTDTNPRILATTRLAQLGGRTPQEEVIIRQKTTPSDPVLGDLRAFQGALARLAKADPADVDPALRAYLGTCSHRIDAWITSLATRQLDSVRRRLPIGTHLGGYGYVEDLHPEKTPDSQGYVLAPSVGHAATAGVLRSGYLAQRATGAESLEVDLSSARVQTALQLMRGVRTGVPLSVLLGYRLERALRDDDLSVLILPARKAFPLRTPPATSGQPTESTPPNNVVEAAGLLDKWTAGAGGRADVLARVQAEAGLPASDPRLAALAKHIDDLASTYDAIADVVLAETVHQIIRGQSERAQAVSGFLDRQEVPIEPDITMTPRSASGYVQRCAVVLGPASLSAAWQALSQADPWADAEPRLNGWLAQLLGEPTRWRFTGESLSADGHPGATATVSLDELGLSPLRAVVAATTGGADQPTELAQRLLRVLAGRLTPPPGGTIRLRESTDGTLGLAEFAALAAAIKRVLANARPADARIFDLPDGTAAGGVNDAELKRRADVAETRMRTAATTLTSAVDQNASQRKIVLALDRVSAVGLPAAVPAPGVLVESDAARPSPSLLDFARDVVVQARARVAALDQLAGRPSGERNAAHHQARLAAVFGAAFPVLGVFPLAANSPVRRSLLAANQDALLGGDHLATVTWMTRLARVRPAVDALWHVMVSAEVMSGYDVAQLAVTQAPQHDGQRWAALPLVDAEAPAQPRPQVAVIMHTPAQPALPANLAALSVDSWTEQIPRPDETAGVSFHYDAPSNRAPQTALLAVPPEISDHPWRLDVLAETVTEAFDLARIRGATLHELPSVGSVLPALYVPLDLTGNVPSIDIDRLASTLGPGQLTLGRD
jgi:hypothetical protein